MDVTLPPFVSQPAPLVANPESAGPVQPRPAGSILTAVVEASTARQRVPGQANSLFEVILKVDKQRVLTESVQSFRPGQVLTVQVLPDGGLRVLELIQPALPDIATIVQQGLREALPLQQNPSILLNNLLQLRAILAQITPNPAIVSAQRHIDRLLQSIPTRAQLQSPEPLKANIANSGTFLEAKLHNHGQRLDLGPATRDAAQPGVREALQANAPLAKAIANSLTTDLKAQLLQLTAALAPLVPALKASPDAGHSNASALLNRILHSMLPTVLGRSGTPDSRPTLQLANTPIDANLANLAGAAPASPTDTRLQTQEKFDLAMSTVLRQIAATIARVQANQFTSLASQPGGDTAAQSWHIEIPVFSEGQFRTLQLIIEREPHRGAQAEQDSKTRQWNITLGFDFQALGEFYATLRIADNTVSTTFWSERPQTLQLIREELEILQASLQQLGLEVKQIDCRKGTPPLKASRLDQQLVDIET